MQEVTFTQWWVGWFLSGLLLLCAGFAIEAAVAPDKATNRPAADFHLDEQHEATTD